MVCKDVARGMMNGENNGGNRGSALLLTLVIAAVWSVCSLMMIISGTVQMRIQRRILMQENNFCYLEAKLEKLLPELETLTGNIAKECRVKALREAAKAAREVKKARKEKDRDETAEDRREAEENTVAEEIDMDLAQELYEERFFYKLKRCLRPKELEMLLGKEKLLSVTAESVSREEDTVLVKGLRLSGSAPGSQIRSSVSVDLRIFVPELVPEEEMEETALDEEDSGRKASTSEVFLGEGSAEKATGGSECNVRLEHFHREKRKVRKSAGQ